MRLRLLRSRGVPFLLAFAAAVAGGLVSRGLVPREAHAQPTPVVSTVYVPAEGIVFRSVDGRPIARLSRDARGAGTLELYNAEEAVISRISGAALAAPRPTRQSYVLDDDDPFTLRW